MPGHKRMIQRSELTLDLWGVDLPDHVIDGLILSKIALNREDLDPEDLGRIEQFRDRFRRIASDYVWNHGLQFAAPLYLVEQHLSKIASSPQDWLDTLKSQSEIDELPAQVMNELESFAKKNGLDLGRIESPEQLSRIAKEAAERIRKYIEHNKQARGSGRHQGNAALQGFIEDLAQFWIDCFRNIPTATYNPKHGKTLSPFIEFVQAVASVIPKHLSREIDRDSNKIIGPDHSIVGELYGLCEDPEQIRKRLMIFLNANPGLKKP